jgi:hypothetical protein
MLGQILSLDEGDISMDVASLVLPMTTDVLVNDFIDALAKRDAAIAIRQLNAHIEQGVDLMHFLDDVISTLRDQLLASVADPKASDRMSFLNCAIDLFLTARRHMRTDEIPQLPAELAIVELCLGGGERAERVKSTGDFKLSGVDSVRGSVKTIPVIPPSVEAIVVEVPRVTLEPITETETTVPVMEMIDQLVLEPVHRQPLTTTEQVFDSVPVISVDEVRRKWPEVFAQVQECNASLPLFLQACEVNSVGGDMVELAFEYDLYVQTVNKEKNRKLVESILERVLGRAVRIHAVLGKAKEKDEVVSSLMDAFGGSVA